LLHDYYKKLILSDVNNYIGITIKDKVKCKGRFESFLQQPTHRTHCSRWRQAAAQKSEMGCSGRMQPQDT
jgi:hypothetical protein